MKRTVWGALGVLSLSVSDVAHAELKLYNNVDAWNVYDDTSSCLMISTYEDDSFIMIKYDARLNSTTISFTDSSVKSLNDGDKRTFKVYFRNRIPDELDDGWGEVPFIVSTLDDGVRMFSSKFNPQILMDIAKYDTIAFFYKDAILDSLSLKGSAPAVTALKACSARAARTHPSDPFANEK